jgi:predicted nucleic acid-binding protein
MIIVDSTVWIDYLNGQVTPQTNWLTNEMGQQRLGITDLILCEVLQGIRDDGMSKKVHQEMSAYEIYETGGHNLAVAAAQNYRFLRKNSITVRKTIDCLIATFCLQQGFTLIHNDRDFEPFEKFLGLSVIHPS